MKGSRRLSRRLSVRVAVAGAAAAAFTIGMGTLADGYGAQPEIRDVARPCYNGVVPGNPYVDVCSLPRRGHKIRGSAPDAAAIIACHDVPGCLSWYVNNP